MGFRNSMKHVLLPLLAVTVTMCVLWYTNRTVIPQKATWEDVQAEARQGGYRLINTQALWDRYKTNQDTPLLVDTRQEWEYRTGHIKGAVNFPLEPTWLSRWRKSGALEKILGANKNRFIVFY